MRWLLCTISASAVGGSCQYGVSLCVKTIVTSDAPSRKYWYSAECSDATCHKTQPSRQHVWILSRSAAGKTYAVHEDGTGGLYEHAPG